MTASIQMPMYQCHKKVFALKIKYVSEQEKNGGCYLEMVNDRYAPIFVDKDYMEKHKPKAGGYYVVYEDGYKSFSPADAFESGYTLIS